MRRFARRSLVPALLVLAACDDGARRDSAPPSAPATAAQAPGRDAQSPENDAPSIPQDQETHPPAPAAVVPSSNVEITGPGRPAPQQLQTGSHILPLAQILQIATAAVPGEVIEVELDDDDDEDEIPEYELEILTPQGRSIEVKIDARRGTILEIEEN